MNKYLLVAEEDGGCDYTIGCGIVVEQLEADSLEDAVMVASEMIFEEYSYDVDRARVYEIVGESSVDVEAIRERLRARDRLEREERDRQLWERLNEKFKT